METILEVEMLGRTIAFARRAHSTSQIVPKRLAMKP